MARTASTHRERLSAEPNMHRPLDLPLSSRVDLAMQRHHEHEADASASPEKHTPNCPGRSFGNKNGGL